MKRETWLPATPASAGAARSIVREAAAEAGLEDEPTWDLMLATTEAVNNAVQHGKPWPNECVLFATEPYPGGLRVEVCDLGSFDSPLEPAPLDATSGRGMQIIATLVDRLEVKNGDGRTFVRFEKRRGRASLKVRREHEEGAVARGRNGAAPARAATPEHSPRVPVPSIAADVGGGA
jgi:anti-sigma regulatory factor (Ser/Thr protein kinase)